MNFLNCDRLRKTILFITVVSMFLTSCETGSSDISGGIQNKTINEAEYDDSYYDSIGDSAVIPASDYSEFDLDAEVSSDAVYINFVNGTADISSGKAELRDGALVINDAGDYVLSGEFEGQVIVNAGDDDNVQLIFSGFHVTADMAPVYIVNAKNASITLADGTENKVADSSEYSFSEESDEPDSAVFSKCDLTINGEGRLSVTGNYGCGIRSKDDLTIASGSINVSAVKDGIKGRDSVVIRDGNINIISGEDGIQSNNDEDAERGYVIIEGGNIEISAGDDGICGETWLQVYDGSVKINESYEGLEAAKIEIYGGSLDITASDDGMNAVNGSSSSVDNRDAFDPGKKLGGSGWSDIFGGDAPEIPEPEGMPDVPDDGVMPEFPDAENMREFSDENMMPGADMNQGFDGGRDKNMPEAGNMPDAGERGNKGGRGSMEGGGMNIGGGMMNEMVEDGVYINISGGTVRVKAGVDVIDSNGTFTHTGGTLITAGASMAVYGSPDGVIDCNGSAVSEGGIFISLARSVGNNAENYNYLNGFVFYPDRNADFSAEISITDTEGNKVMNFTPGAESSVILVSSDLFEEGKDYSVMFGETVFLYSCSEGITAIK